MRVFVTGGTGFIGSAVVADLLAAGHRVVALARSETSAAKLRAAGAEPHLGTLEDLDSLRAGVGRADAVVHTAFNNTNVAQFRRNAKIERTALSAMGEVLTRTGGPLVAAGGFAPVQVSGQVATENDPASPKAGLMGRNVERTIMALADQGMNASVVRLPCVHGDGDHFTLRRFIDIARAKGKSAYVGDGANRIPAVHKSDAARVFRLAVERAVPGSRYHAVAEEGVVFRDIAEVLGRQLGVPVVGLSRLAAWRHFGVYAGYASGDGPASSTITRDELSWRPEGPGLLPDLDRPEYVAGH